MPDIQAQLSDREAIRDCLYRYCRGIDRADETALRSAYWPDGSDDHGPFKGSAEGFIAWALQALEQVDRSIHQIHNILFDFHEGGVAVESYFSAFQRQVGAGGKLQQWDLKGRYLDWFVKRGNEWRILNRKVVYDWVEEMPLPEGTEQERFGARHPVGEKFPADPLYTFLSR
ncbi:MAG: nuclear transport factor 2 family protein [Henriciella sp.]|nr:nuclear transport factor 2 family protein [Henriciella sp.]